MEVICKNQEGRSASFFLEDPGVQVHTGRYDLEVPLADRFIIIRLMLILLWIGISQKWNRYHRQWSGIINCGIIVWRVDKWIANWMDGWRLDRA